MTRHPRFYAWLFVMTYASGYREVSRWASCWGNAEELCFTYLDCLLGPAVYLT